MWPRLSRTRPRKHPRRAKPSLASSRAGRSIAGNDEIQQARYDIMLACLETVAGPASQSAVLASRNAPSITEPPEDRPLPGAPPRDHKHLGSDSRPASLAGPALPFEFTTAPFSPEATFKVDDQLLRNMMSQLVTDDIAIHRNRSARPSGHTTADKPDTAGPSDST